MQSKLLYQIENHPSDKIDSYCRYIIGDNKYRKLCQIYEGFDEYLALDSSIHGITHIERVSLLGLLLSDLLCLSDDDTSLLLTACVYHDIGRQGDGTDSEHGIRGALKVHDHIDYIGEELHIIEASIEAHCANGNMLDEIIEKYVIIDTDRAVLISRALKDADALDRVRLSDLEPSYLRFHESWNLIDFAEDLYWFYH